MASKKDIKYLNKNFDEFRSSLIDYTKTYYPQTYNDFSPSSPGMMFMEMAAYVGDILSFYLDNQVQENYLQFARQSNNLYELAYMFGYKPNVTQVAITDITFYQKLPSILSGGSYIPDFDYSLIIEKNSIVTSTISPSISFLIDETVDFSFSSSLDPTEISILEISSGNPSFFLLKKTRKAISSKINTKIISIGNPEKYHTEIITDNNIVGILDCLDSDNNEWHEVDYLAQETIYNSIKNTNINDPNFSINNDVSQLLKLEKIQKRFVTRFIDETNLQIQFGAGTISNSDEEIIPNPDNIGIGLPFEQSKLTTAYSPSNFLFTKTYGIAPSNTSLTFRYLTGGGINSNVPSNDLITLNGNIKFLKSNINSTTAQLIYDSLAVTNLIAADGGGDGDTIEEIRNNSMANFSSQLRNVTPDDYLVRTLSLPSKFGVVAKAYIEPTKISNKNINDNKNSILDLYILTYDLNKNLKISSNALKQNLITYLSQYKMTDDAINIKDGFIINIGLEFDIMVLPEFNNNEILSNCINVLQDYFLINKWQINQPIVLREIYILLDKIEGVLTVKNIKINNKVGENIGYSKYAYDIEGATRNNIVYPSLDPCIFEIKFPSIDISGRCVGF